MRKTKQNKNKNEAAILNYDFLEAAQNSSGLILNPILTIFKQEPFAKIKDQYHNHLMGNCITLIC